MRKGLLVPLVISIALHVVFVGAAELFYATAERPAADTTAVSYDRAVAAGVERPGEKDGPEPAARSIQGSISLETSDPRFRPYFNTLRTGIEKNWRAPSPRGGAAPTGRLVVLFTLGRDGKLLEISVQRSSGERELDFSAVESVKSAAPFAPFPADIAEDRLSVRATFVYD